MLYALLLIPFLFAVSLARAASREEPTPGSSLPEPATAGAPPSPSTLNVPRGVEGS